VDELARGGQLRIAVRVSGDDAAQWTSRLGSLATVEHVTRGTATLSLDQVEDAQRVLDIARQAGPVEQFGFERRRLSQVFRDVVGANVEDLGSKAGNTAAAAEPVR
jgi:ABC-type uncharacterized transport system ATPase subunit